MKKTSLLLLWVMLSASEVFSQTPPFTRANQLTFQWGLGQMARQDQVFSPFVHQDWSGSNMRLTYSRTRRLSQFLNLSLRTYQASVKPVYNYFTLPGPETEVTYPHGFTFADLQYGLGKTVLTAGNLQISTGLLLTADFDLMNYSYGKNTYFGYFSALSAGLWAGAGLSLTSRQHVQARLGVPLLAWIARSPYLINDDTFIENTASHRTGRTTLELLSDGSPATLNRYQQADLRLDYSFRLTERWQLNAGYQGQFIRHTRPRPLLSYENTLYTGISFQF